MNLILRKNFSFLSIILINTVFFSGYYVLKDPLSYILHKQGMSLTEAYSVTTSANVLLALSSLFFGFTLHNCVKQKFSLLIGLALSVSSIYLLSMDDINLNLLAISLYVVGGGLYFFNIIIFINRQFNHSTTRIRGNYLYQIFVNGGAVIGCMLFLSQIQTVHLFKYSIISGTISLFLFSILYKYIHEEKHTASRFFAFSIYLLILFCIIFFTLHFRFAIRWIVLFSFISTACYIIYRGFTQNNRPLLLFMSLLFLFSIPYWIANTLIFNEFFFFLTKDVTSIYGLSPIFLIMIDPLANMLFGSFILFWQRDKNMPPYSNLFYSSLLMVFAFLFLCIGLYFSKTVQQIHFLYPLITITLFACAEFLLQTTLNSKIRDLLSAQVHHEFLATGMLRASRAFATVIGYYLMLLTTHSNDTSIQANLNLYTIIVLIFIGSCGGILAMKKAGKRFILMEQENY